MAIANDDRLRRFGMALNDLSHELAFGDANVGQRLSRLRLGTEDDKIDRMPVRKRDADLAVRLKPADPRSMSRARVDNHVRPQSRVRLNARRRPNLNEQVIYRSLELAAVDDGLVVINEHQLFAALHLLDGVVAHFAHDIEEQNSSLARIGEIFGELGRQIPRVDKLLRYRAPIGQMRAPGLAMFGDDILEMIAAELHHRLLQRDRLRKIFVEALHFLSDPEFVGRYVRRRRILRRDIQHDRFPFKQHLDWLRAEQDPVPRRGWRRRTPPTFWLATPKKRVSATI